VESLALVDEWPGSNRGVVVVELSRSAPAVVATRGDLDAVLAWASITKLVVAHAALVLADDGIVTLEDDVADTGATVAQLLAHAGGIAPGEARSLCPPGTRRIYSSAGYDLVGRHLERASGLALATVLTETVLGPLGLRATSLEGSAGAGMFGSVADLGRLLIELARPSLLGATTATREHSVAWPGLGGVLPGFGSFDPCDWGLGPEVKGQKTPHWTGARFGPATFGHFGQAGGFLVIEPALGIGVATLGDAPFGPWAPRAWPQLLDSVAEELRGVAG
jgi:CubicO group peptidase (beta-lactamase class C family)